jgi:HemK-related putative methylase
MSKVYEAAEDSELLLKTTSSFVSKQKGKFKICEIGVGSGYVLSSLAKNFSQHEYFGSDISSEAIKRTKKEFENIEKNVQLSHSSFLEAFKTNLFDCLLFNAPYLPLEDGEDLEDLEIEARALYGGKKGYEVIEDALLASYGHFKKGAKFFLLFSSLSKKDKVDEIIAKLSLHFTCLSEESHFFETLYCYQIEANTLLKELDNLGVQDCKYFARGKHSMVYKGTYKKKKVVFKVAKEQHLDKEAYFLEKLSKEEFVPKLFFKHKEYLIQECIDGKTIKEFLKDSSKKETLILLQNFFELCGRLDSLGLNKFELTNPYKHVLIDEKKKMYFIDFERCLFSKNPKNRRQALQYFRRLRKQLKEKGIGLNEESMRKAAQELKEGTFTRTCEGFFE